MNQNSYYWTVTVQIISDWTGYTPDEAHEMLKWKFLRREEAGKPPTVRSTADLTTSEAEDYYEQIRRWAGSEGVRIPMPNEI